jgi:hypothetical protein
MEEQPEVNPRLIAATQVAKCNRFMSASPVVNIPEWELRRAPDEKKTGRPTLPLEGWPARVK